MSTPLILYPIYFIVGLFAANFFTWIFNGGTDSFTQTCQSILQTALLVIIAVVLILEFNK